MAHKKNKHQSLTDHDNNEVDNRSNINNSSNASMNNTNSSNVDPQPQNKARKQKNKRTNHHSNNNNNNNNTVASSSSSTTTTTSRTPSPTNNNNNNNSNSNNNINSSSSSGTTKKRKRSKAFNRKQQVHHANEEEESEDDVSNNAQPTTMDSSSSSSSSSSTGAISFSEDSHKKKKKKRNRNRKRQKLNNQQQEQEEEQDTHSNSNNARKKRKKYQKNQTTSSSNNNNEEEEDEDEDMNTNNNNTNLFERIIQSLASSSSNSGDSESSSSGGGGGDLFGGIISGGGALRLSNEKVNQLLTQLSEDAGMGENYDAVSELCHFLSMSNEQSLSQVSRIGEFVPHLVRLLQSDENYDLALVSARALTNMIDAMPATSHFLIRDGAIAVFIEKLLNIEYIDLAEQCIQCLYVMICQNVGVTVSSSSGQMNRTSSAAIHHHLHLQQQQQQQHRHHHHHHGSSRLLSYMNDFDSPISAALSTPLLKSGVLMAVLMFIDFFSLDIQRKIALVASQLCRRITSEDLFESAVKDAIPNLIQFLHSSDSKIVECGCKCFYRIACALAHNDEKLQYLIQVSNGQILDQFYNILSLDGDDGNNASHNTAVNKSAVSRATLSSVINFFTIVSHGSFSVCQMLHERGIAIMLSTLLEHGREDHESNAAVQDDVDDGDADMENSASGVDLTQNSSNSNNSGGSTAKLSTNNSYSSRVIKEHLGEILQLLLELLPDRSLDNKNAHHTDDINFVTELSPQSRKMLLQTMATPVQYLEWDSVKQLSSPSSSASTQPPAPSSSPHALLSQLRRMASTQQQQLASSSSSSSSEERTQFEQKKSLFEKNPDLLINFGQCMIPLLIDMFSSTHVEHVANRCLTVIGTVLYFSTPDMLKTMLLTIPISTFISSVLASPRLIQVATAIQFAEILMSKLPDIFSEYLVREGVLYQIRKLSGCEVNDKKVSLMLDMMKTKVLREYQKAEKTQKEQQEKLDRAKKEKAEQEEAEKNSNAGSQMTDDDNEEQESKQATTVDKVHFVPPKVHAPDPPVSSSLSSQKCDHSTMTSLELLSYVVAVAQLFQQKYFADSSKFNSVVVSKLSDLASELKSFVDDPSESEELECLKSIRSMLIEGVSNFEVFSSGIISALNNYLTKLSTEIGHDDDVNSVHVQRFRRICTFCKVFDQRIEDPAQPTTVGGASQQLHQSPYRVNRSDSLTRSPGFSPLSLRRTSLRMASDLQPPHTYLIELVRKVQDCLTSVENFGLIVNEHHGLLQSVAHTVHALSKPMKLRITKRGPTDSKKKAVVFEVMISPLAELSTVLQFLQSRSSKQKDESSEDSPQKKQKREQEESEKQEVEDEEGLEDDDDVDEDEEEDDEEEVKTPHENVNVSTSATSYFEVEEEEEEDFNGSRLTNTVDITESKKSTSSPSTSSSSSSQADNRYKFLDEQSDIDEKDKDQQQGPIAFQLYMNGKLLNPLESVFQALYSHTRKPGKTLQHPATMRLWDSTHSMEYEEVLASSLRTSLPSSSSPFVQQENNEPEDEEDWQVAVSSKRDRKSQQQKRVLSEKRRSISQSGIIKYATIDSLNESQTAKESLEKLDAVNRLNIALDRDFASVLTLNSVGGVDEDAVSCLNLLRLINLLNVNTDILPHIEKIGEEKRNRLIMKREFINAKLQSKLIRQLQDPYILFTKCMPSWVTQLISHCGFLFSYDTRKLYFHLNFGIARAIKRIQERQLRNENNHNVKRNSNMVRMEKQKIKLAREPNFLQSAFKVIEKHGVTKAVLEFEYENEEGTGLGPTLEFYTLVSAELQKAKLNIWKDEYTAEDDSNDKQNEDSYHNRTVKSSCGLFPKPIDSDDVVAVSKARRIFRFLGRFVARALYDDRIVDLPFSNALYKAIQGHKLQYHDLKLIDPILYKQLESMRALVQEKHKIESSSTSDKNKQKKAVESLTLGNDGKTTIDMLYQVFVLPGYPHIELKPGGSEIDVTIWNLEEYIELIIEHLLRRGISNQAEAFRKGFSEVISLSSLTMLNYFSFAELDDMICGCEEQWTVQYLMENTHCDHGYTNSSRAVQYFFSVLSQMNSTEQRLFLKFVTGCVKLPSGGLKALSPKMTIVLKPVPSDAPSLSPDMFLPSVMTCANFIKLPNYSSEHVLKTQLMKAIEHGQNSFLLS